MPVLLERDTHLRTSHVLNSAVMCGTANAFFLEWVLV